MTLAANQFQRNDWVIYRKQKSSVSPGPRASEVHAAGKGNSYRYVVEKYWVVEEVLDNDRLKICTRRGKRHLVDANDPSMRKARWWERLLYRSRFEAIDLNSPVSLEDEIESPAS
ncbi:MULTISPECIES: hypothetical protein [Rhodopirellula]|uniref:hypothetical protein n=1 Tax=Rhodopirellula TaxID=265488 RepID=UPI00257FE821|nr:hypothetical protein [Rhodopirellula sp. UBA1907]|tara:strand:+ start:171 stop:515 length:345 start_codon:yes stop_codon:yes gene_type:complete